MKLRPSPPGIVRPSTGSPPRPEVTRRKMFGYPSAFVNGNLCCGTFDDHLMLRLSEADRVELEALGGTPFEPMPGRCMRGYLALRAETLDDESRLHEWFERSAAFTRTLPPKTWTVRPVGTRHATPRTSVPGPDDVRQLLQSEAPPAEPRQTPGEARHVAYIGGHSS